MHQSQAVTIETESSEFRFYLAPPLGVTPIPHWNFAEMFSLEN